MRRNTKILISILFLILTIPTYGQVFVKGIASLYFNDYVIGKASLGAEYKYDRLGIEYIYSTMVYDGDNSFADKINQIGLKYYFKNSDGKFKFYTSPFLNFHKMKATEDIDSYLGLYQEAKGTGYGISIGCLKDFGKHFGLEIAPCYYYLHTNTGNKFKGVGSYVYYRLTSRYIMGLRIYMYFKFNLI